MATRVLFRIFFLAFLVVIAGSLPTAPSAFAQAKKTAKDAKDSRKKPRKELPTDPAPSCDLGYILEDFTAAMKREACFAEPFKNCWQYNTKALAQNAVWMIGMGAVGGVKGLVLSAPAMLLTGFEEVAPYGGGKDSDAAVERNAFRNVLGIECAENRRYMTTNMHIKNWYDLVPEEEEEEEEEEKTTSATSEIVADGTTVSGAASAVPTPTPTPAKKPKKTEEEKHDELVKKACEPVFWPSKRMFEFLSLARKERSGLLCKDKELRDYYAKLTRNYRKYIVKKAQKITGLRCFEGGDRFLFAVTEIVGKNATRKTLFDVKENADGLIEEYYSFPDKRDDNPHYGMWKQRVKPEDVRKENPLFPGSSRFVFDKGPDGTILLKEAQFLSRMGMVFNELKANPEILDLTFERFSEDPNVIQMKNAYRLFQLWANEAHACCEEKDTAKYSACLAKLDVDKLNLGKADAKGGAKRVPAESKKKRK